MEAVRLRPRKIFSTYAVQNILGNTVALMYVHSAIVFALINSIDIPNKKIKKWTLLRDILRSVTEKRLQSHTEGEELDLVKDIQSMINQFDDTTGSGTKGASEVDQQSTMIK